MRVTYDSVTRDSRFGHAEVPISISSSISESESSSDPPNRSGGPPDWWAGAIATTEMAVGTVSDPDARWLEYEASRERKGWSRNHTDAVGWLTSVVRREREQQSRSGGGSRSGNRPDETQAPRRDLSNYEP